MQPGDVTATYADISAINALTGYSPKVPLARGIERFVDWYLARNRKRWKRADGGGGLSRKIGRALMEV